MYKKKKSVSSKDILETRLEFWKIAKSIKYVFWVNCLVWILVHASPLILGILSKKIFDFLESKGEIVYFYEHIRWAFAILILNLILIYFGANIDIKYKNSIKKILYKKIINHVLISRESIEESKGSIIDCLNSDVNKIVDTISYFIDMIGNFLLSVIAIYLLFGVNAKLALIIVFQVIMIAMFSILDKKKLYDFYNENRKIEKKVAANAYSFVESRELVKMMGLEDYAINFIKDQNNKKKKVDLKRAKLLSKIKIISQLQEKIIIIIVLSAMVFSFGKRSMSLGDFSLFVYYGGCITQFTTVYLSSYLVKRKESEVAVSNLNFILAQNNQHGIQEKQEKFINKIAKDLLNEDIDVLELLGDNGSGKTYIIENLFSMMKPYYKIAILTQRPVVLNISIRKNIILDQPYDEKKFNLVISLASLTEGEFSKGFDGFPGILGAELSGGQIFRIALARVLYHSPEYLIIDGGLNSIELMKRKKIVQNLCLYYKGRLLITTNTDINYINKKMYKIS